MGVIILHYTRFKSETFGPHVRLDQCWSRIDQCRRRL